MNHITAEETKQLRDKRMRDGAAILSFVWFDVAKRVVETAIKVYNVTPEQTAALKKVFLRPGDYRVAAM
jgi:hypothetical protein